MRLVSQPFVRPSRVGKTRLLLAIASTAVLGVLTAFLILRSTERDAATAVASSSGVAPAAPTDANSLLPESEASAAREDSRGPGIARGGFRVKPGVRLSGPGRLSGRVLDRATGAGVEGTAVELLPLPPAGKEFFGRADRKSVV